MKWDVLYIRETTGIEIKYSEDYELNYDGSFIEAGSADEALLCIKYHIAELMNCNALEVQVGSDEISVFEPSDHEFIERYFGFSLIRMYTLLDENGNEYLSDKPGLLGGHRKLKIYGQLDCPSAKRYIAEGQYIKHRVFFADEKTAVAAGYRPCARCMKQQYEECKAQKEQKDN